jgi:hypothetical protein
VAGGGMSVDLVCGPGDSGVCRERERQGRMHGVFVVKLLFFRRPSLKLMKVIFFRRLPLKPTEITFCFID